MIDGEGKEERGERGKGGKGGRVEGGGGKGRDKIEGSRTNDQWSVG